MALFKSQILTQASGSVGGLTFFHTKGGLAMRARAMPVDPNTTRQVAVRNGLTNAVNVWGNTLTPTQRDGWSTYAANVPLMNKLGDPIVVSGQNMYVRSYTVWQQINDLFSLGIPAPAAAPVNFNLGDFTLPTNAVADAVTGIAMDVTSSDAWANDGDSILMLFQGRPMNPSRNYFRGPWRLIGFARGDNSVPPTTLAVTAANVATRGYPLVADQAVNLVVALLQSDGRLSTRRSLGHITITP